MEQGRDIRVIRSSVPGPIGYIARFAGKGRRTRYDNVKQRARSKSREQVRTDRHDPFAKTIGVGVFGGSRHSVRVDVDGNYVRRPRPRRRKRKDAGFSTHVGHPFAGQVKATEEACEEFARQKYLG